MATRIRMKHRSSGIIKDGFFGFSWTTLFWGPFPALFRGDFLTFFVTLIILSLLIVGTMGIGALLAMIIWAFKYNRFYTRSLLEKGYSFAGTAEENARAAAATGVELRP